MGTEGVCGSKGLEESKICSVAAGPDKLPSDDGERGDCGEIGETGDEASGLLSDKTVGDESGGEGMRRLSFLIEEKFKDSFWAPIW